MTYKIVKDKDGKMSTEAGPHPCDAQRALEKTRKELKDMIAGNTTFHDDPFKEGGPTPPATAEEKKEESSTDGWYNYGNWGMFP